MHDLCACFERSADALPSRRDFHHFWKLVYQMSPVKLNLGYYDEQKNEMSVVAMCFLKPVQKAEKMQEEVQE
jgi:hypothetical protein